MFDANSNDGDDSAADTTQSDSDPFDYPMLDRVRDKRKGDDGAGNIVTISEDDRDIQKWGLGSHNRRTDIDFEREIEQAAGVNEDLAGLLREAQSMVSDGGRVGGFECQVCGLNHGHSDRKHDIRSAFNASAELVEASAFCPFCHCGVNELAMLMDYFGVLGEAVVFFDDQDTFEGVLELDNDVLQSIMKRRRSGKTLPIVVRESGLQDKVPDDLYPELARFYQRWLGIKAASNKAPIARETQNDITSVRNEVESFINTEL